MHEYTSPLFLTYTNSTVKAVKAQGREQTMSPIYDNWGKLVAAVVKKEQLWQLCHEQSRSPSLSSESSSSFSFNLGSIDDVDFSGPIFGDFDCDSMKDESFGKQMDVVSTSSSVLVKDQLPDAPVPTKLPVPPLENSSSNRSRRRSLVIEVPKLEIQSWDVFDKCQTGSRCSLTPSPGTVSPVGPLPSFRIRSAAATPIQQGAGRRHESSHNDWPNDAKQKGHPLPLPPKTVSPTSPSLPRTLGRATNLVSPGSPWKKGKLIDRGPNGCIYIGFNSETGEMCAMKEVILFSDDAETKKRAKQLKQEIAMLSSLCHPNIVQYYGSEVLDEKLYIYSEYISGGTVSKILTEYGRLGESAIRSYTKQILSGLAYLHSKSTVHRDIRGATVLVNPSGSVKLASFGTAKHTIEPFDPSTFEGLPYWMAPEIIRNSRECGLAVDIWSVGCTILEMATARPPWSQYGGAVALFKIGYTNELPIIPDDLSGEGKGFVGLCLQRNPLHRPTAAQLLKHPFMKSSSSSIEQKKLGSASSYPPALAATSTVNLSGINHARNLQHLDSERVATHSSRVLSKPNMNTIDIYTPRYISTTVSPVAVAAQTPSSPQRGVSPAVPVPLPHPPSPERLNRRAEPPRRHWYEI